MKGVSKEGIIKGSAVILLMFACIYMFLFTIVRELDRKAVDDSCKSSLTAVSCTVQSFGVIK